VTRAPRPQGSTPPARPAWRGIGVLCLLAIALGCAWMAWQTHGRRAQAPGLTALAALPDGAVWLAINQELWHLDAQGRLKSRQPIRETGLSAAPLRLAAPDQRSLYALVPKAREVAVLDASTARLQRRIALQWPSDLPQDSGAIDLAVAPDGRIALAHAAAQAVLLFDAQGRLLARSASKALAQPTSVWWDDDDLWVADASQHQLLRLSGSSLATRQTIQLSAKVATRHTVRGVHHPRAGIDIHAPVATLIRLEPGSRTGLVTYEWADGMEIGQDAGPQGQPRDLAWIGETLLVLENFELRLLRFDVDRRALGDFGDMAVQRWLEQGFKDRERLRRMQWAWAGGGALSLLLMLGLASTLLRSRPAHQPEEAANARALRWLDENPAWQAVQLEQEHVRETIELQGAEGGLWLVLSNRRLVAFRVEGQQTLPRGAWHRTDVSSVELTAGKTPGQWRLGARSPACRLRIRLNDGTVLQGGAQSRETAERMAAVLRLGMPPAASPVSTEPSAAP
jgi:hypothetical protein